MRADRQGDLTRAFVLLADTLVPGYDVVEWLQQLVEHTVDLLDVSAAGILLADAAGRLRVAAASREQVRLLELFQLRVQDGPCLECFATRTAVVASDPDEVERRWPTFAVGMAADGFLSVAAVPLRLREDTVGVMGLFTDRVLAPDAEEVVIAQGLADIATIGVVQARLIHDSQAVGVQLQGALDSRVVLEQAKGVVAAQAGLTMAAAFALIRSHARTHGLHLADLTASIVSGRVDAAQLRATTPAHDPASPPDPSR